MKSIDWKNVCKNVCGFAAATCLFDGKSAINLMFTQPTYSNTVKVIVKSDMLDSYKREVMDILKRDGDSNYYKAVMDIVDSDMLGSSKRDMIKSIS